MSDQHNSDSPGRQLEDAESRPASPQFKKLVPLLKSLEEDKDFQAALNPSLQAKPKKGSTIKRVPLLISLQGNKTVSNTSVGNAKTSSVR